MLDWETLSGKNKWNGLLEPLNDELRRYIIRYGEMAEATYKAYDTEGDVCTCKYEEDDLFSEVGLGKGIHSTKKNYKITKFIHATAGRTFPVLKKDTNCMGYVAVATEEGIKRGQLGRRDIVVAWRGTKELSEWENNMKFYMIYPTKIFGDRGSILRKFKNRSSLHEYNDLKVHSGFYKMYTTENNESTIPSASQQVRVEVSRLLEIYKKETISVTMTGHSLGGALAALSAMDIEINVIKNFIPQLQQRPRVTAFTFGCPQFGNSNFVETLNTDYLHILRIENKPDIVPRVLPWVGNALDHINNIRENILKDAWNSFNKSTIDIVPEAINKLVKIILYSNNWVSRVIHKITHNYYKDVGQLILIDTRNSSYLKNNRGPIKAIKMAHNLEVYLHGISGTQGVEKPFKEKVDRDIALLNKDGDYLEDQYNVPASWWDKPNKANMVQKEDGSWKLRVQS